jgi:hypothetical protein
MGSLPWLEAEGTEGRRRAVIQKVEVTNARECRGPGDGCATNVMVGVIIGLLFQMASALSNIERKLDARAARNRAGLPRVERDTVGVPPNVENDGGRR